MRVFSPILNPSFNKIGLANLFVHYVCNQANLASMVLGKDWAALTPVVDQLG